MWSHGRCGAMCGYGRCGAMCGCGFSVPGVNVNLDSRFFDIIGFCEYNIYESTIEYTFTLTSGAGHWCPCCSVV